jgi:hypothetical protein
MNGKSNPLHSFLKRNDQYRRLITSVVINLASADRCSFWAPNFRVEYAITEGLSESPGSQITCDHDVDGESDGTPPQPMFG